ncbi:MAG: SDR family NAD(P)-dependent oxidoreductase [Phototrophicaceae bacterium]
MRFLDKNVIVTGAGQGIGYALCEAFAREGANVALNDIDHQLTEQAANAINAALGQARVSPHACDVAVPHAVYRLVEAFEAQVGAADVVIANAGITHYVDFLHCTPETFDRLLEVNLRGAYFLAQAAAKQMIAAKRHGRIVLMSSVVGISAFPYFSVYSITKAALVMMAKSLALELAPYKITVNAISPGATVTERTVRDDPNYAENWATVIPTEQALSVADIVNAALFLAAPESSQITGQNLVVDGGWTLYSPRPEEHPDMPEQQALK